MNQSYIETFAYMNQRFIETSAYMSQWFTEPFACLLNHRLYESMIY